MSYKCGLRGDGDDRLTFFTRKYPSKLESVCGGGRSMEFGVCKAWIQIPASYLDSKPRGFGKVAWPVTPYRCGVSALQKKGFV